MRRFRERNAPNPGADDYRPRAPLSDTVIRREKHTGAQLIFFDHPVICFIQKELVLQALAEAVHIFDDESPGTSDLNETEVLLPKLVAWIVHILAAEIREPLAGRSSDHDVSLWNLVVGHVGDVPQ